MTLYSVFLLGKQIIITANIAPKANNLYSKMGFVCVLMELW